MIIIDNVEIKDVKLRLTDTTLERRISKFYVF